MGKRIDQHAKPITLVLIGVFLILSLGLLSQPDLLSEVVSLLGSAIGAAAAVYGALWVQQRSQETVRDRYREAALELLLGLSRDIDENKGRYDQLGLSTDRAGELERTRQRDLVNRFATTLRALMSSAINVDPKIFLCLGPVNHGVTLSERYEDEERREASDEAGAMRLIVVVDMKPFLAESIRELKALK